MGSLVLGNEPYWSAEGRECPVSPSQIYMISFTPPTHLFNLRSADFLFAIFIYRQDSCY